MNRQKPQTQPGAGQIWKLNAHNQRNEQNQQARAAMYQGETTPSRGLSTSLESQYKYSQYGQQQTQYGQQQTQYGQQQTQYGQQQTQYGQQQTQYGQQQTQYGQQQTQYGQQQTQYGTESMTTIERKVDGRIRTGTEIVVGHREHLGEDKIVSERYVEHSIMVPKRVLKEDYIEKLVVVPEKVVHEEIVEEQEFYREKIIEIMKPVIHEKIIEVPEYEYVDKIVEVPETIMQEKITEVPKIQIQERIVEHPKVVVQEKVVEVPEIEYKVIPIEKIVEVPEIREQIVTKEIPITQYIDKPIPEYVTIEEPQPVERFIPVPVEVEVTQEFAIPILKPRYHRVDVPLYVPRFIEIPVHSQLVDETMAAHASGIAKQVALVGAQQAASLCEAEDVAAAAKGLDFNRYLQQRDAVEAFRSAFLEGRMSIGPMVQDGGESMMPHGAARLADVRHAHTEAPYNGSGYERTQPAIFDPQVAARMELRKTSGYTPKKSPSKMSSPSRRSQRS